MLSQRVQPVPSPCPERHMGALPGERIEADVSNPGNHTSHILRRGTFEGVALGFRYATMTV